MLFVILNRKPCYYVLSKSLNLSYSFCFCISQRVFVWDLDETIIIFHSLLTGSYATRFGKVSIVTFICTIQCYKHYCF